MATSRSRNAKHSEPEIVSPPEMTIPGTQTRHFEIISLRWERTDVMSRKLTEQINALAKRTRGVVTVCGQSQDNEALTITVEYWRF